ncbi:MAG: MOSC domain-containing protein [Myxococcota bacterium]
MRTLRELMEIQPNVGRVEWLGVRPARRQPLISVRTVEAREGRGLQGDHKATRGRGKRQVTLIQQEHLNVVAELLGKEHIDPALLRRNVVVSGINLLALRNSRFQLGTAMLEGADHCHPCSRMEEALGLYGYNAMRGHGGIVARILNDGVIALGDQVRWVETPKEPGELLH